MRVAGYTATYLIKASWENVKKKKVYQQAFSFKETENCYYNKEKPWS